MFPTTKPKRIKVTVEVDDKQLTVIDWSSEREDNASLEISHTPEFVPVNIENISQGLYALKSEQFVFKVVYKQPIGRKDEPRTR